MQNEAADFKYVAYNTVYHIRLDFIHIYSRSLNNNVRDYKIHLNLTSWRRPESKTNNACNTPPRLTGEYEVPIDIVLAHFDLNNRMF